MDVSIGPAWAGRVIARRMLASCRDRYRYTGDISPGTYADPRSFPVAGPDEVAAAIARATSLAAGR
jgi:hypothetical protein